MEPQAQTLVGQGVEWIDDYNDVAASAWSDMIPCHSFLQGERRDVMTNLGEESLVSAREPEKRQQN